MLPGKFTAELTCGGGQSKIVQLGGMQLMGHVRDVSRDFVGQLPKRMRLLLLRRSLIVRRTLLKLLESIGQQSQPLVDVVVQFARNALTFRLLRMEEAAA